MLAAKQHGEKNFWVEWGLLSTQPWSRYWTLVTRTELVILKQ